METSETRELAVAQSGKATEGFGVVTLEKSAELAAVAMAASAKAEVEAAYIMALKRPRNEHDARARVREICLNPTFARKAKYRKPVGSKKNEQGRWEKEYVVGPSIRFAEEALRHWGNVLVQQPVTYDDEQKRIVKVTVRDLESNLAFSTEIVIDKTVERRNTKGRDVVRERLNSEGEKVAIVRATEDEIQIKQAALVSKAIRNNGLRLIPDHIVEEAMEVIQATLQGRVQSDPKGEAKKVLDALATMGILPSQIEKHLETPIEQLTPAQIISLQEIATSIQDGHATWAEYERGEVGKAEPIKGDLSQFTAGDPATHTAPSAQVGKPVESQDLEPLRWDDKLRMASTVRELSEIGNAFEVDDSLTREMKQDLRTLLSDRMAEVARSSKKK